MRPLWILAAILGLYVASAALGGAVAPELRSPLMSDLFARMPVVTMLHLAGGAVALVTGVYQVNRRFRARHRKVHRALGIVYVLAILAAGSAAFPMAATSFSHTDTRFGLGLLGACWIATTLLGFAAILNGDVASHRRWIIRSFALTLAAVMLRIYLPVSGLLGISFEAAYRVVVWLCWMPNLVVAEIWLVRIASTRPPLSSQSRERVAWPFSKSS